MTGTIIPIAIILCVPALFLVLGAIAACMLSSEISQRERDGFYEVER